jgi:hypothetical protein
MRRSYQVSQPFNWRYPSPTLIRLYETLLKFDGYNFMRLYKSKKVNQTLMKASGFLDFRSPSSQDETQSLVGAGEMNVLATITFQLDSAPTHRLYLELARPHFRPAFDHHFLLGEELDRVHSLTVHDSEEGLLPAAEGEESHRCRHPDIDAHIPGAYLVAELACR